MNVISDPKDSGLDFRSLLRHKDMKGRKKKGEGPDWGDLKHSEYLIRSVIFYNLSMC